MEDFQEKYQQNAACADSFINRTGSRGWGRWRQQCDSAQGFVEPRSAAGLEEAHSPMRMEFIAEFISGFFNPLEGIEQAVKNVFQPGEIRYSYCVIGAHRNDSGTPHSLSW